MTQLHATEITLDPGTPEWVAEMTASKVAAVLGLSPWESPFSLWYRMAGQLGPDPETPQQTRGHYLEPAVATWLADQYDLRLSPGRCWRSTVHPWQVASPDRLAGYLFRGADATQHADAVVEVKTAADWEHWGPDGGDEIPPYYRVQVIWQCDTLGLPKGYVGVLLPRLEFRGYVITPEPGEAEFIRDQARAFLDSLAASEPPDVDGHSETYRAVRRLHPEIDGTDAPVEPQLAYAYAASVQGLAAAKAEAQLRQSQLAVAMGDARRAVLLGDGDQATVVANRQAGPTGQPYVKATQSKRTLAALAALHTQEETDE
jgi:putative phage-type endonuclease